MYTTTSTSFFKGNTTSSSEHDNVPWLMCEHKHTQINERMGSIEMSACA
jgi:hypothetical protein